MFKLLLVSYGGFCPMFVFTQALTLTLNWGRIDSSLRSAGSMFHSLQLRYTSPDLVIVFLHFLTCSLPWCLWLRGPSSPWSRPLNWLARYSGFWELIVLCVRVSVWSAPSWCTDRVLLASSAGQLECVLATLFGVSRLYFVTPGVVSNHP